MRRNGRARRFLVLCAGLALAACGRAPAEPVFTEKDCRRVDLVDAATGRAIVGAEDLALRRDAARLVVSAYDRHAVERALRDPAPPLNGGLYEIALPALFSATDEPLSVPPLAGADAFPDGLRPHGLAIDPENGAVVFVNRGYQRKEGAWVRAPELATLSEGGAVSLAPVHCAANDVAISKGGSKGGSKGAVLVTYDHGACGFGAVVEDILARRRSGAVFQGGDTLIGNLRFANGALADEAGFIIAATRERALHLLPAAGEPRAIALDGAPDNLSLAADGSVIVAVHPSLWRLALDRKLGIGRAPSRIVSVDLATGAARLLFDDPKGALFRAATVGVLTDRGLVAGSATDAGLLVCEAS